MTTSVVLFTRDLRLHDHPPLRAALDDSRAVVPLFVRDRAVDAAGYAAPNRLRLPRRLSAQPGRGAPGAGRAADRPLR